MEQKKSTKPSFESCDTSRAGKAEPMLNLPDDPDFISIPPDISLSAMCRYIEELRKAFPNSIPTDEERLRAKVDIEFKF